MKTRAGVLNGTRVDYFKGSSAVKAILSPAYKKLKGVPQAETEEDAEKILHGIIPFAFFLRVDRGPAVGAGKDAPKVVQINQMQMFKADLHYVWLVQGSQLALRLGGLAMVALMLAAVMFPLWPPFMRLGVWYLSMGVLGIIGLFFGLAIFRLIFYVITIVVARPGIWIFPNLFEDVGFVDSFIPLWAWDVPPPKKGKKAKKAVGADDGAATAEVPASGKASGVAPSANGKTTAKRQAVANLPGATRPQPTAAAPAQAAEAVAGLASKTGNTTPMDELN
ncbi:Translocation protein S62 [Tilletia horrida]|nr:Translocation protein S62 [Tilletia horrida]